jgi:hypothetical protein
LVEKPGKGNKNSRPVSRTDSPESVAGTAAHIPFLLLILFLILIRPANSGEIKKKIKIMIKNKSPRHTFARIEVSRSMLLQIKGLLPNLQLVSPAARR